MHQSGGDDDDGNPVAPLVQGMELLEKLSELQTVREQQATIPEDAAAAVARYSHAAAPLMDQLKRSPMYPYLCAFAKEWSRLQHQNGSRKRPAPSSSSLPEPESPPPPPPGNLQALIEAQRQQHAKQPQKRQLVGAKRRPKITPVEYLNVLYSAALHLDEDERMALVTYEKSAEHIGSLDSEQLRKLICATLVEVYTHDPRRRHKYISVHDAFHGGRYLEEDLYRYRREKSAEWQDTGAVDAKDEAAVIQSWHETFTEQAAGELCWKLSLTPNHYRMFYLAFNRRPELLRSHKPVAKLVQFIEHTYRQFKDLLVMQPPVLRWDALITATVPQPPRPPMMNGNGHHQNINGADDESAAATLQEEAETLAEDGALD